MDYREQWQYAKGYHWSSLPGYVSERHAVSIIDYDLILLMVGGRRGYRDFVIDGLKRDIENPFKKVKSRIILGGDEFVTYAKQYLRRVSRREQPSYRELMMITLEPEVVLGILTRECGINKESLQQRGANGVLRGIVAELLYKYCEITQVQIGGLLGDIDYVSVHQMRRRLKKKMAENTAVRERYKKAEARIKAACTM